MVQTKLLPGTTRPVRRIRAKRPKRQTLRVRGVAVTPGEFVRSKSGQASIRSERAVVILPGLGNAASDYKALRNDLQQRGLAAESVDVRRADWLRNITALRDLNYWRGTLKPRPFVDWYLTRVDDAVEKAKRVTDGAPVTLLAHSAGGWLGRIYMKDFGTTGIDSFVTLGSPHLPPPEDKPGVFDQTRGILFFCQQEVPGNFHPGIHYVTVAGKYLKGCKWSDDGSLMQKLIGTCYKQVCGEADVWGDGVVPAVSAHLEGALKVELPDVYHSPVGSTAETGESKGQRVWYGSKSVADKWLTHLAPQPSPVC